MNIVEFSKSLEGREGKQKAEMTLVSLQRLALLCVSLMMNTGREIDMATTNGTCVMNKGNERTLLGG